MSSTCSILSTHTHAHAQDARSKQPLKRQPIKRLKPGLRTNADSISESISRPLPDFFDSDLSDGQEFYGFPREVLDHNVPSCVQFEYELSDRFTAVFGDEEREGEFVGFTREEL